MTELYMFCNAHPILAQLIGAVIGIVLGIVGAVTALWLRYF